VPTRRSSDLRSAGSNPRAPDPIDRAVPPITWAMPIQRPRTIRTGSTGLGWAAGFFDLLAAVLAGADLVLAVCFLRPGAADRAGEVVRVAIIALVLLAQAYRHRLLVPHSTRRRAFLA